MSKDEFKAFAKEMRENWSHIDLSTDEKLLEFCKKLVNYLKPKRKFN